MGTVARFVERCLRSIPVVKALTDEFGRQWGHQARCAKCGAENTATSAVDAVRGLAHVPEHPEDTSIGEDFKLWEKEMER